MLDPSIYELMEIKIISQEEIGVEYYSLFQMEVNKSIKELKEAGYIVEVGNMTSMLTDEYINYDLNRRTAFCIVLLLYKTKEQLRQEEEKTEYLATIEEYMMIHLMLCNLSLMRGKAEIGDLVDKILEKLKEAEKIYNYKSQEYKDHLKDLYESFKEEYNKLKKNDDDTEGE